MRGITMTLNQLEYFCAVCRYQSITRAANELFVSQPTISLALRNLEQELNLRLFNHGKNQIKLTSVGETFYERAQVVLKDMDDLHTEFSLLGQNSYTVKVGVPPLLSSVFSAQLLSEFDKKYGVPVRLYEYGSARACHLVETEVLDVAIANIDMYNVAKFNYHLLAEYRSVFCVHRSHPLAGRRSVTLKSIGDEPIIMYNTDSVHNKTIMTRYNLLNITPKVIMYASQIPTIENTLSSRRCGFFVYDAVPLDEDEFVKIPIEPPITTKVGLAWKKGIYLNDCVSKFIDLAKSFKL